MTERTITAGAFDLATGNLWTCGAIAIPNPTNGVAGQVGVIRVTAAPTSFGNQWDFPGGAYTAPTGHFQQSLRSLLPRIFQYLQR